jgi:hypothetical protein
MEASIGRGIVMASLFSALLFGCAGSPAAIAQLDADKIQTTKAENLCRAYTAYKKERKVPPAIEGEVARRGLSCRAEIEVSVPDCSEIDLVSSKDDPIYKNVRQFTVRNNSSKAKHFRIADVTPGISSSRFTIAPGTTKDFAVVTDRKIQTMGALSAQVQRTGVVHSALYECVTAR